MWTITLIGLALVLWLMYRKRHFSQFKKLGIPGPEPNILFGNILEIVSKNPLQCHKEWLKKYGNVVGYYFGTSPVVIIADVNLLKKIQISDFHKFINRPNIARNVAERKKGVPVKRIEGFTSQLISLRDKKWKEIRSIITPSFTASKMKQMAPIINGAIDSLLKNVEKKSMVGDSFDVYPMYQGLTMDVIGRTAFGIQTDVQNDPNDSFLRCARVLFSGDVRNPLVILTSSFRSWYQFWSWVARLRLALMNKGTNPVKELIESVKKVIAVRRKDKESRRPDLLQLMMEAEIEDSTSVTSDDLTAKDDKENTETKKTDVRSGKMVQRMTDGDILDNSVLFFLAGYETTSTALAFTTHFLLHYPEVQDKIRKEVQELVDAEGSLDYNAVSKLQYLDQVLQESLRLLPPIYLFVNRECGEDVDFGTFHLKEGMAIQVPTFHLQRSPELWGPDADEFNPERFSPENKSTLNPLAFQAFGQGPRNCVGMRFATMEAKLALARLLLKYKLKACAETEKEMLSLKVNFATLNPKRGIWLKAVPV